MRPERFAVVRELVASLATLPASERPDHLRQTPTPDLEVRREVESLLALEGTHPGILTTVTRLRSPVITPTPPHIGRYSIVRRVRDSIPILP